MRIPHLLLLLVCGMGTVHAGTESAPPEDSPCVAVMVSDDHYKADSLLEPFLQEMAEKNHWKLIVLHGKGTSTFSNMDELNEADVLIVYVRRLALPKEQLAKVKEFIASGKGVIGMRTASHAFTLNGRVPEGQENWAEFDREVLGGNYHGHGKDEIGTDVANVPDQKDSPILKGVTPEKWHSIGSLYFTDPIAEGATVYQWGSSEERQNIPLTWTRMSGKSRVAYTALGHPEDYKVEAFRQLLENLIRWTLTEVKP